MKGQGREDFPGSRLSQWSQFGGDKSSSDPASDGVVVFRSDSDDKIEKVALSSHHQIPMNVE